MSRYEMPSALIALCGRRRRPARRVPAPSRADRPGARAPVPGLTARPPAAPRRRRARHPRRDGRAEALGGAQPRRDAQLGPRPGSPRPVERPRRARAGSSGATSSPVSPSTTTSGCRHAVATMASRGTRPRSARARIPRREGERPTSAAAKIGRGNAGPRAQLERGSTPSRRASARSRAPSLARRRRAGRSAPTDAEPGSRALDRTSVSCPCPASGVRAAARRARPAGAITAGQPAARVSTPFGTTRAWPPVASRRSERRPRRRWR